MPSFRRGLLLAAVTVMGVVLSASAALAQSRLDPTLVAERNDGGWIYWLAYLLAGIGGLYLVLLVVRYMRYAPRFARDDNAKVVYADRLLPGRESPRRQVDLSQAVPIVAQPPALPAAVAATATAPAPAIAAPAAAAPDAPAAPAEPAEAAPAPSEGETAETATGTAEAPAAPEPTPPPAAAAERVEVTMDQEVFDAKLAELLAAGTDRRVAEGQARRAGMIAARKKAEGEA